MASTLAYTWQVGDNLRRVAARFLDRAGYQDVPTFVRFIQVANRDIYDWQGLAPGTTIVIPFATS